MTRRAKLTPADAGLPDFGGTRRVPGLRREEVALLAGISAEYYTRLERNGLAGISDGILDALVRALQLDAAEREHLFDLARAAGPAPKSLRKAPGEVSDSLRRLLDGMTAAPAFIRNGRLDILAINPLGELLYSEVFEGDERPVNLARFCFLSDGAHRLYPDWEKAAEITVALLHTEAGRYPDDDRLAELVRELSARSDVFRTLFARHDVRLHQSGYKDFRHPEVGDLHLSMDALQVSAQAGLTFTAYSAEPGTPSEPRMRRLAEMAQGARAAH